MVDAQVVLGKAEEVLPLLEARKFHALVTDPPAGVGFLKRDWDGDLGGMDKWTIWLAGVFCLTRAALRPGAHAAVWAMGRTSDCTGSALRRAGFLPRQLMVGLHNQGSPMGNLDAAKAVEGQVLHGNGGVNVFKKLRGPRNGVGGKKRYGRNVSNVTHGERPTAYEGAGAFELDPQTEEAKPWLGWGTRLSEDADFWWLCRLPLEEATVAKQLLKTGTGALNVRGCATEGRKHASTVLAFSKATLAEKEAGCEGLEVVTRPRANAGGLADTPAWADHQARNSHPTVKSLALCRHLVRLTCPPGGWVLDPFAGSGTIGCACILEGRNYLGIEMQERHAQEALARMEYWATWRDGDPEQLRPTDLAEAQ